jgi:hypothetical protein
MGDRRHETRRDVATVLQNCRLVKDSLDHGRTGAGVVGVSW